MISFRRLRVRLVLHLRSVVDVLFSEDLDDAFIAPLDPDRERVQLSGLTEIQRSTRDNLVFLADHRRAQAAFTKLRSTERTH